MRGAGLVWAVVALAGIGSGMAQDADPVDEAALRERYPCRYEARARDFDFWLGRFEVRNAQGELLGRNLIEKAEEDCVLVERWTSAGGGTGMSMNFYNPIRGEWRQVWVSSGLVIDIAGGLVEDAMVLEGHVYYTGRGEQRPFRGTWTPRPGGVVRQFFEESADGGETYVPWFEGFYHPVGPEPAGSAP